MTSVVAVDFELEVDLSTLDGDVWEQTKGGSRATWTRIGIGAGFLLAFILCSWLVPTPYSPITPNAGAILSPPSALHWFGTDQNGMDVFSRTIAAAHLDLVIAMSGALIGMVVGSALGLLAGVKSRGAELFMRLVDAWQAFPLLILLLAIVSLSGGGMLVLIVVIGLVSTASFIRLVRAESLSLRETKYVQYAEVIGVSTPRTIGRHVLRNATGVILVQASLASAGGVGVIAALSYLGQGLPPPTASWGGMIQLGSTDISQGQWWPVVFPAAALVVSILAINLVADGLERLLARDLQR